MTAIIDFESRSECDLKRCGSYIYSIHKTTKIFCLSYILPSFLHGVTKRWNNAFPNAGVLESELPTELFTWIKNDGLVEAHNAFFERSIWSNIMVKRFHWPEIKPHQWRCSLSKSSAASLPRSLDGACKALDLDIKKDKVGHKLMLSMCKPRNPIKSEKKKWKSLHGNEPMPILYKESEQNIKDLWNYCDNDVLAEKALSEKLPELTDKELKVWLIDQELNWNGLKFDLELARAAIKLFDEWVEILNSELHSITGIVAGTKRKQLMDWINNHSDLNLTTTGADELNWQMEKNKNMPVNVMRVMQIMLEVNKTSTAKYTTMLRRADPVDHIIRDLLLYCGGITGRWAAKGVQTHNFPARNLIIDSFEYAVEIIKTGDLDLCRMLYGDVVKLLSHSLRGAIIPSSSDKDFIVADYSAIEANCLLWAVNDERALIDIRKGRDIYCDMASKIYGYSVKKKTHPKERQFGKQIILGLGYGMGFITFFLDCRKYNIKFTVKEAYNIMGSKSKYYVDWVKDYLGCGDKKLSESEKQQAYGAINRLLGGKEKPGNVIYELALMKYVVDYYRKKHFKVVEYWYDQEAAAIKAVKTGKKIACGFILWYIKDVWLYCQLPSGRSIKYCHPKIELKKMPWGKIKPVLSYNMVVTQHFRRVSTYGGKIVENIIQGIARDIMANAMLKLKNSKYKVVMSIHDELISEVGKDLGSIEEFVKLISEFSDWAEGCPVKAEGKRLQRYEK